MIHATGRPRNAMSSDLTACGKCKELVRPIKGGVHQFNHCWPAASFEPILAEFGPPLVPYRCEELNRDGHCDYFMPPE